MRIHFALACCLAFGSADASPLTLALSVNSAGQAFARDPQRMTKLNPAAKLALLRQHVRYVFILFQENRSFDHYFGTYPGANGLFASFPGADPADPMQRSARDGESFRQTLWRTDGSFGAISPFLAPREIDAAGHRVELFPEDLASVEHSHEGLAHAMHVDGATRSRSRNDAYALVNEGLQFGGDASSPDGVLTQGGGAVTTHPDQKVVQMGELVMAHLDCDTIPFLWQLADRFTLFDNFHQTTIGPSTPNAIAMIAGQSGETQWALHPGTTGLHASGGRTIPVINDSAPFPGSADDNAPGPKPPNGPDEQSFGPPATAPAPLAPIAGATLHIAKLKGVPGKYNATPRTRPLQPLTFASLPLSFMGNDIGAIVKQDENPALDLLDVQGDIAAIGGGRAPVAWRWYQQGYGREPFDGRATVNLVPASTAHPSYIVHHNGPQYFGYVGDNPAEQAHLHSLDQFTRDLAAHALPAAGGVFTVRGGYYNNDDLQTLDPNPDVRAMFAGNDDHPGYSDSQISEALIADTVNAIAASPYWPQSAIIITYDETDGLYDHVPERVRAWGPDGLPLAGGPRIPAIVISPFSAAHSVSHVYSEHSSVIKFIDALFGLTPLADLPDERRGRKLGADNPQHDPALRAPDGSAQHDLGPADDLVEMGDLSEAFDNDRLLGRAPPLPAQFAMIDGATSLPHDGGAGCTALKITPTDYRGAVRPGGEIDPPPPDFNPRPVVSPGIPARGDWTP